LKGGPVRKPLNAAAKPTGLGVPSRGGDRHCPVTQGRPRLIPVRELVQAAAGTQRDAQQFSTGPRLPAGQWLRLTAAAAPIAELPAGSIPRCPQGLVRICRRV